jgi:hypothetical protein
VLLYFPEVRGRKGTGDDEENRLNSTWNGQLRVKEKMKIDSCLASTRLSDRIW